MEAAGIEPAVGPEAIAKQASTCDFCPTCGAARALHDGDSICRCMTLEPRLKAIIDAWADLPESLRQVVETLCLQPASCDIVSPD
jgi:hypothetical protein